ncbi:hypothetical protein Glove_187g117 [Diversispora epigaea]|uniref:Uncharacterized protein n=1 Tax=Diversispora epigaea TaxID=1348612 RepID=A0A397IVB6_9GLOM|nr:hypothetical protein Glove_187g117 [Diversispora epigaea]
MDSISKFHKIVSLIKRLRNNLFIEFILPISPFLSINFFYSFLTNLTNLTNFFYSFLTNSTNFFYSFLTNLTNVTNSGNSIKVQFSNRKFLKVQVPTLEKMINLLKENGYYKDNKEEENPNGHKKIDIGDIDMVPTPFLLYFLTIQNELMNSKTIPYKKYSKELSMVTAINWRKADKEFRQAFSRMTIKLNRDERFLQK